MSKERARRREARLQEQAQQREQRRRQQARKERVARARSAAVAPGRAAVGVARGAWRPLAGGQEGLLARRRRRRVVSVLVVAALVNVAVWLLTADLRAALTCAALTVVATPVLGRLMFSRR